jgi:5-methylcytosine-specific restriction endonuclease McrA
MHGLSGYTNHKCRCDTCRTAWRAYQRAYKRAKKPELNVRLRERYVQRSAEAIEFLGGRCANCGSVDALEFDHIDPKAKEANVTQLLLQGWDRVLDELSSCQLLCASCHQEKTSREWAAKAVHGTDASYERGCRCAECRQAHSAKVKQWHRRAEAFPTG